jgi:hypothetical protein
MRKDNTHHGSLTNRRRFLKALGAVGLAGCGGDGDDTEEPIDTTELPETSEPTDPTEPETETQTPTATGTEVPDQPLDDPAGLLDFGGNARAQPGATVTLSGTVTNPCLFDLQNVGIEVDADPTRITSEIADASENAHTMFNAIEIGEV